MKITSTLPMCVKALLLTSSLAWTPSVIAFERPVENTEKQPGVEHAPKEKAVEKEEAENKVPEPAEKIAMLGIGGNSASDTLSLHLGLTEGSGLTVYHVVPDSAAAKAGIKRHDIITAVNDSNIGSQRDLRRIILTQKPGDEVTVKLIKEGKAEEKKVILGERVIEAQDEVRPRRGPNKDLMRMLRGMGANIPEADRQKVENEMRKHMQELQRQFLQNGDINPDQNDFKMRRGIQMLGGTSMTVHDNQGSVTIKTLNDKKEVIVRNKEGKLVFEGPYETEQDKAAVPDDIADRIKRVDIDMMGGVKLKIGPGGVMPVPEQEEGEVIQ